VLAPLRPVPGSLADSRKNPGGTADLSQVPVSTSPPFARSGPVFSPSAPVAESNCPTTSDSRSCTGSFSGSFRNPQSTARRRLPLPDGLYPFIRFQHLLLRNYKRLCLTHRLLPLLVDPLNSAPQHNPFAPSCFKDFTITTGCSAPRFRIRTLALMVFPLELLRLHRSRGSHVSLDRRPTDSGHLNAGCSPARDPVLPGPFPSALTTMAFDHSRREWFGTCSCKPVPRGLPSPVRQLHT
jgi:hypothetical protein